MPKGIGYGKKMKPAKKAGAKKKMDYSKPKKKAGTKKKKGMSY